MNKKLTIVVVIAIILIGGYFMLNNSSDKEALNIEADLDALELTDEEKQALIDEGIELPSDSDSLIDELQEVSSSDEVDDIEADLSATDLDDLDAALDGIDNDLLGL